MSEASGTPKAKAGWYPHPSMADTRRYWDGDQWTDHIAPATAQAPAVVTVEQSESSEGVKLLGAITAVFIPIIGLVIGLTQLNKKGSTGVTLIVLSILFGIIWMVLLTS